MLAGQRRALDLLGRHAGALTEGDTTQRSATYAYVRDQLHVPAQWLETAIAWRARATDDVRLLPQALLLAGEWQELHECALRDVAPAAFFVCGVGCHQKCNGASGASYSPFAVARMSLASS